ncbi:hypothetical protein [Gaoshiqia sp. Z1-71]|uniref:hypothetical protein n=1 Tax=Gaoshiqia hydrogeniformans TaxID=3290090 RepID=UPI003BF856C3
MVTRSTTGTTTIRSSVDVKEWFRESFEASGTNSQGEFLEKLLERWHREEPVQKAKVETIEVFRDREFSANEILMSLPPAQLFALRQTILSIPDFAEKQNEMIDSLSLGRPLFYFGNLYDKEFRSMWVRNTPIIKNMSDEERESAIKHNMYAFLLNMFSMHIVEGKLSCTKVTPDVLRDFIQKLKPKGNQIKSELKPVENESSIPQPDTAD